MRAPQKSYIICTTPRSGSTWLSDILRSTGVAGDPREYFYHGDFALHFKRFGVSNFSDYLPKVIAKTQSKDGTFGLKIMAYHFLDFVGRVKQLPTYQDQSSSAASLMAELFPNLKYIWLTRRNRVRQAVSQAKAHQTGVWHDYGYSPKQRQQEAVYKYEIVDVFVRSLIMQDATWQEYFSTANIAPLVLVYEDLVQDTAREMGRLFDYLELDPPESWTLNAVETGRTLANKTTETWIELYLAQSGEVERFYLLGEPAELPYQENALSI